MNFKILNFYFNKFREKKIRRLKKEEDRRPTETKVPIALRPNNQSKQVSLFAFVPWFLLFMLFNWCNKRVIRYFRWYGENDFHAL